jgi:hypothetical protein
MSFNDAAQRTNSGRQERGGPSSSSGGGGSDKAFPDQLQQFQVRKICIILNGVNVNDGHVSG